MKTLYISEDGKRFKENKECAKHEETFSKEETADNTCIDDKYNPFEYEYIPFVEDGYISSATKGDFSSSNPWDAPGMSIRNFI